MFVGALVREAKQPYDVKGIVEKIDKLLLTGNQKMRIFDTVLMSRVSWDLLIHDMSPSFVAGLGALQTRKFKEWSHYAKHGNATVFYRSAEHFGLKMKEMVPFFKTCSSSNTICSKPREM